LTPRPGTKQRASPQGPSPGRRSGPAQPGLPLSSGVRAAGSGAREQPVVCRTVTAQRLGLAAAIDERLKLLKVHLPYSESDHVLNLAYNALAGGTCIEDL